jgi:hypothetical protein
MLPVELESLIMSFLVNKKEKINAKIKELVTLEKVQTAHNFRHEFVGKDYWKINYMFSVLYYSLTPTQLGNCSKLSSEYWWFRKLNL